MGLKEIYKPIEKDMGNVETAIKKTLENADDKFLLELNNYAMQSPGKRIRAALVLLSAKAAAYNKPGLYTSILNKNNLSKIAAAFELVHMASLIHDDIMDESSIRHNKPTINSKFGDSIAITYGDYLYSLAFGLASECGSAEAMKCLSHATNSMCQGQMLQLRKRNKINISKDHYMLIIKKKTGALFGNSCLAGALVSSNAKTRNALKGYGLNFGIAFQIIDDYLDLVGKEEEMGKNTGRDMFEGEVTLPLLNLVKSANPKQKNELIKLILKKDNKSLQKIKSMFLNSKAEQKTIKKACSFLDIAKSRIKILQDSVYKKSLEELADFVVEKAAISKDKKY